ncbi:B3/B4 domain-containing protein [Fictibacillus phosphorivorans]|uniref:B3/B4 domain-containing protein n=1 Tax=Fictibacillus phosphorivorans TaxID=1221500 RepID=UPI00204138A7|nr:phenylalanine--tRNA ligase beta subunit-related protein [Fictibacillus phosphorivorans]MCM3717589.1 phenylalanine--tRNA ligase beta subunit-related protein [Fictibacillus phosphorivorans]MCM3775284.1 phenylalanine--tRNA ligase beta subunit-related protein [Fictibacillus phosphorivorans]
MITISPKIKELIPNFKIGTITYHDIAISESPQMIKGRFQLFLEALKLEEKTPADYPGVSEYRSVFKKLGTDPSRYRPASEALLRRVLSGKELPPINSGVDVNNFFSIRFGIPIGLYNLDKVEGDVEIRIGKSEDAYEALNGREMNMEEKLLSADSLGAFGSPIVDSKRTMVDESVTNALHIVYLQPSMEASEALEMLESMAKMFTQVNGGTAETQMI